MLLSPGRWLRLGLYVTLAAIAAWFAFAQAFAVVGSRTQPAVALRVAPDAPLALVRDATVRLQSGQKGYSGKDAQEAARRSVLALPLNGPAMELLGVIVSSSGAPIERQREVLLVSSRLDRRDAATQLILIEEAVARNDVRAALDRYDVALRLDDNARVMLYPVLTRALDDPAIRRRFAPYLAAPPPWMPSFLRFAVSNTERPASLVTLAREGGGFPQGPAYSSLPTELLSRIIGVGQYRLAVDFYRDLPKSDPALLRSLTLTEANTLRTLAPIAWQVFEIDGIDALFVADADGKSLAIEARIEALYSGPVAKKVVALAPGRYRFTARFAPDDPPVGTQATIRLTCVSGGQAELLSRTVPLRTAQTIRADIAVPAGCAVQEAMISVANPTGSELDLTIDRIALTKL